MSLLKNLSKNQTIICLPPKATVQEATEKMTSHHVGSIVIQEDSKLLGIFTERDLMNRVIAKKRDPDKIQISEVMSPNVCTSSVLETVEQCFDKMQKTKCRHLPILDDQKVVGMVTMRNILEWLIEEIKEENSQMRKYIQS